MASFSAPRSTIVAGVARGLPRATLRLRFREMVEADLDEMAAMLGDPEVMRYYPAPRSRDEAREWILSNQRRYAEHGFGLWIIETRDGTFVGDLGVTWQEVNGQPRLEVGYHVKSDAQGQGFATEAAVAAREYARSVLGANELVAIIHPENAASRRVAEHLGMTQIDLDYGHPWITRVVMGMTFKQFGL